MVVNVVIITIDYIFIIIRLLLLVDGSLLYTVIHIVFQNIQLDIFKNDGSLMDLFWINLKQFMYCFVDPPAIFEF